MSTPNNHDKRLDQSQPAALNPKQAGALHGSERRNNGVSGAVVLLTALVIFVVVAVELCSGISKAVNAGMLKDASPSGTDAKTMEVRQLGSVPSSPEIHRKLTELTQPLPTPQVQADESNQQDVADLHAREDLLLENYTWEDRAQGKMRIPIERAMALIAQSGLPVAPKVDHAPLLAHDSNPVVARPLTNGFARTGYEQEQAQAQRVGNNRAP